MNRIIPITAAVLALGLGLVGCGQRPDPCTTAMPAPTQAEIDKVNRGLEVDESIEVDGYEVECVLIVDRGGSATWVSEIDD